MTSPEEGKGGYQNSWKKVVKGDKGSLNMVNLPILFSILIIFFISSYLQII